jgi:hypothetical protein
MCHREIFFIAMNIIATKIFFPIVVSSMNGEKEILYKERSHGGFLSWIFSHHDTTMPPPSLGASPPCVA